MTKDQIKKYGARKLKKMKKVASPEADQIPYELLESGRMLTRTMKKKPARRTMSEYRKDR
jgi:hypothetical protein